MEFTEILEILVLTAIVIELFSLYNHHKLDNRIDAHLLESNECISKSNETTRILDEHMIRFDEHINKINEHMSRVDEHMVRFDEHINGIDEHMVRFNTNLNNINDLMIRLDEHIHALLDEHVSNRTKI